MAPIQMKLGELAKAAGVSPRTVRYYIAQGVLPSPGRLGPMTRYGREHLERLQLIRRLQDQRLSLAEIRSRVTYVPMPDALAAATIPPSPAAAMRFTRPVLEEAAASWLEPMLWERIPLSRDIELHVRRRPGARRPAATERLVELARELLS